MQLAVGFIAALLIATLAFLAHSLNRSGAFAAVIVGTVIFGLGGWQWAVLLMTFFISSSALTRTFKKRKAGLAEKFSKGSERDAGQVFGNGGLATLFAGLHFFFPVTPLIWLAFAASLAAVNADTWATELGVLNPQPPRLITNLHRDVEQGTSGGISPLGTLAALMGGALIGVFAVAFAPEPVPWTAGVIVSVGGLIGSIFDSLLGATEQAIYHCPTCIKETERHPTHTCGTPTTLKRGREWLDNDLVNFACSAVGAITATAFVLILA
jgi:uncharacterized protein (TIGR00297 family)